MLYVLMCVNICVHSQHVGLFTINLTMVGRSTRRRFLHGVINIMLLNPVCTWGLSLSFDMQAKLEAHVYTAQVSSILMNGMFAHKMVQPMDFVHAVASKIFCQFYWLVLYLNLIGQHQNAQQETGGASCCRISSCTVVVLVILC